MFGQFTKRANRIDIKDNSIFINNEKENIGIAVGLNNVFNLTTPIPEFKVFENLNLVHTYRIETVDRNPDLTGQFIHSSIRILANSAVMTDGIISQSERTFSKWTDKDYEAIRFQPFYLSDKNENNSNLLGKGLFERGLHFNGKVTPGGVRNICICDSCNLSFTIEHFHAGFSERQYFYPMDSKETLLVPYSAIEGLPTQLQKVIENKTLEIVESKLPMPTNNSGTFKYYNSIKRPHCMSAYIDFEKHKEIRPNEYYGNTYINQKTKSWTD